MTAGRRESSGKSHGMSSLGLTPGTPMMADLENSLRFYISHRLKKWSHVQFELSGTTVPVSPPSPPSPLISATALAYRI